jgi:hypothetical protein
MNQKSFLNKTDLKVGDILQIKGALGFEFNPKKEVIEIREQENGYVSVLLDMYPKKEGGLLSHMNQSWHGLGLLKYEILETNNQ